MIRCVPIQSGVNRTRSETMNPRTDYKCAPHRGKREPRHGDCHKAGTRGSDQADPEGVHQSAGKNAAQQIPDTGGHQDQTDGSLT